MHAADLKYRKINIQMQRPGYNRPKFPAPQRAGVGASRQRFRRLSPESSPVNRFSLSSRGPESHRYPGAWCPPQRRSHGRAAAVLAANEVVTRRACLRLQSTGLIFPARETKAFYLQKNVERILRRQKS